MQLDHRYRGIFFMLLAALGFSIMGASAKMLRGSFNAGQLVFFRNAIGLLFLVPGLIYKRPINKGQKLHWLAFRGMMGTAALYTLLFCILHMPLGTAMTYNVSSTLFLALFSFILFGEYHGRRVLFAILLGFTGMLLIYKPNMYLPFEYHMAGLLSAVCSAVAYITLGRLALIYDSRIIVLAFLVSGVFFPSLSMTIHYLGRVSQDDIFIIGWRTPHQYEWIYLLLMGLAALFGQYFVTLAYTFDKAGIVSAFSYSNIVYSIILGLILGDPFPDPLSLTGICLIIGSGIIISLYKRKK